MGRLSIVNAKVKKVKEVSDDPFFVGVDFYTEKGEETRYFELYKPQEAYCFSKIMKYCGDIGLSGLECKSLRLAIYKFDGTGQEVVAVGDIIENKFVFTGYLDENNYMFTEVAKKIVEEQNYERE